MYRDIKVKRISAGSMLKLIAIGLYLSIVPLSLLVGGPLAVRYWPGDVEWQAAL
jgi:hypothetical protein